MQARCADDQMAMAAAMHDASSSAAAGRCGGLCVSKALVTLQSVAARNRFDNVASTDQDVRATKERGPQRASEKMRDNPWRGAIAIANAGVFYRLSMCKTCYGTGFSVYSTFF